MPAPFSVPASLLMSEPTMVPAPAEPEQMFQCRCHIWRNPRNTAPTRNHCWYRPTLSSHHLRLRPARATPLLTPRWPAPLPSTWASPRRFSRLPLPPSPRQPLLVSYDCSHPTVTLADNGGSSLLISYLSHSPPSRGSPAFLFNSEKHSQRLHLNGASSGLAN